MTINGKTIILCRIEINLRPRLSMLETQERQYGLRITIIINITTLHPILEGEGENVSLDCTEKALPRTRRWDTNERKNWQRSILRTPLPKRGDGW